MPNVTHIKNPLTLITFFAGATEVISAASIFGLNDKLDLIIVLFLVLFPTLLVLLFFATLNWNHKVLYAPSDYKDEKMFNELVRGTPSQIMQAAEAEASDQLAKAAPPANEQKDIQLAEPVSQDKPEEAFVTPSGPLEASTRVDERYVLDMKKDEQAFLANVTLAKQSFLAKFNRRFPGTIRENVIIHQMGYPEPLMFDGLIVDKDAAIFIEVKYTRSGRFSIDDIFRAISFIPNHSQLALGPNAKRVFILGIVLETDVYREAARNSAKEIIDRLRGTNLEAHIYIETIDSLRSSRPLGGAIVRQAS